MMRDELANEISGVENLFDHLNEIVIDNSYKKVNEELASCSLALIRTFQNVNKEYERKKNELGVLDFEDILLKNEKIV